MLYILKDYSPFDSKYINKEKTIMHSTVGIYCIMLSPL